MIARSRLRRALFASGATLALTLGALVGLPAPAQAAGPLPCDIYGAAGTPCVAAHSTVRALFAAYNGPLYQVTRASDGATPQRRRCWPPAATPTPATQDAFCNGTTCSITIIYDQTPRHNDLTVVGPAGTAGPADYPARRQRDRGHAPAATRCTASGSRRGIGYRHARRRPASRVNGQPEGMYMVASGTHVGSDCCFDYGNAEAHAGRHRQRPHGRGQHRAPPATSRRAPAPARGSRPTWRTACSRAPTAPTPRTSATTARTSPRC